MSNSCAVLHHRNSARRSRALHLIAVLLLALPATAGTFVMTGNADSGPGTLRQAILDANSGACAAPCEVTYGFSPVATIELLSPLPDITRPVRIVPNPPYQAWTLEISGKRLSSGSGLHVRGTAATLSGLIINGFPGSGIVVEDGSQVLVSYCIIGLDPTGSRAVPNRQNGITVLRGHDISLSSNTIAGNGGHGVYAVGTGNIVFGLNTIGKQHLPAGSGDQPLSNGGAGVFLQDVQGAQFLGDVIAFNALQGIATAGTSSGIIIEDRSLPVLIYGNGGLPIDLGFDGVTDAGRPRIRVADISNGFLRVIGEVSAAANSDVLLNIFASDAVGPSGIADAQIALYANTIKTDASGLGQFEFHIAPQSDVTGKWISATATTAPRTPTSTTSELSSPLKAAANNQNYEVTSSADSGPGSLRQAILDANGGICSADFPCRIEFSLPDGVSTITPLTPLPAIARSGIIIDGENTTLPVTASPNPRRIELNGSLCAPGPGLTLSSASGNVDGVAIRRLAINGFHGDGILIDATANAVDNPLIVQNFIGTDRGGTSAVPNDGAGIRVKGNVPFIHVGTYGSGNRLVANVISGNALEGVRLEGGFFELDSNAIGTDLTRKKPVPNGRSGVQVEPGAQAHLELNTLAFNRQAGLVIGATTPAAFKASIYNAIHSNGGPAIVMQQAISDTPRQTPPEIRSATYDPATGTTTVEGFVTPALLPPGWWSPVLEFAMSTFPENGGRGSGETVISSSPATLTPVGDGRSSFQVKITYFDPRGKRISGTATPFSYQGFKGGPVGNIFGQGFVYGTTSEMSKAVPVVTAGCPAGAPQVDTTPRQTAARAVELRWSTAAGASAYNVWLRELPGVPRVIGNTAGASLSTTLGRGQYEWFVEALFPGCPSVMSEAAPLTVTQSKQRAVSR